MSGTRFWPGRAAAASGRWPPASRWPRWTVWCPHPAQSTHCTGRGRVLGHRAAPHLPRGALRLHLRRHQLPQGQGEGILAPGQGYNISITFQSKIYWKTLYLLVCTGKEAIPGVFPFTGHVTNKKWPLNEGRRIGHNDLL